MVHSLLVYELWETYTVSLFQILREFLILLVIYNAVPSQKTLYKLHIPSLCFVYVVSIMCMSCNSKLLSRLVSNIIFSMLLNFPPVWVDKLGRWQQAPATIRGKMSPLSQQLWVYTIDINIAWHLKKKHIWKMVYLLRILGWQKIKKDIKKRMVLIAGIVVLQFDWNQFWLLKWQNRFWGRQLVFNNSKGLHQNIYT